MSLANTSEYEISPVPIHRWGMWWFLGSEIAVFGGLLVAFLLFRLRHPEWASEAAHTLTWVGSVNTIVLLSSSFAMILAHHYGVGHGSFGVSMEQRYRKASRLLGGAILLGVIFLCLKSYEYVHEIHAGLVPAKSLFWGYYFLMTGLHALHMIAGIAAIFIVWLGLLRRKNIHRVESAGIYWHFVDLVWIFLFPLLYLEFS